MDLKALRIQQDINKISGVHAYMSFVPKNQQEDPGPGRIWLGIISNYNWDCGEPMIFVANRRHDLHIQAADALEDIANDMYGGDEDYPFTEGRDKIEAMWEFLNGWDEYRYDYYTIPLK